MEIKPKRALENSGEITERFLQDVFPPVIIPKDKNKSI